MPTAAVAAAVAVRFAFDPGGVTHIFNNLKSNLTLPVSTLPLYMVP